MNASKRLVSVALLAFPLLCAGGEPSDPPAAQVAKPDSISQDAKADEQESAARADKRYDEMLDKMQAAVEEIAQLYGNPLFLQVFTNDLDRASELKARLRAAKTEDDIRNELADLEKRRGELQGDIALKEREAARLAGKLVRQRAALDALSAALEQVRMAVEDTAK